MIVFWKWGLPLITGKSGEAVQSLPEETYVNAPGFVPDSFDPPTADHQGPWEPKDGEACKIKGNRFDAEMSTRGAALTHLHLRDPRCRNGRLRHVDDAGPRRWRSLTLFRRRREGSAQVRPLRLGLSAWGTPLQVRP
jgi:hypothetical protein